MKTLRFAGLLCSILAFIDLAVGNVAFKVQYNANTTITNFQEVLKFDNVIFDTYSAYSPETGLFTAPLKGIYFFSVLMQTLDNSDGDFFIRHLDNFEAHMTVRGGQDSRQMSTIAEVDVGDTVHVGRGYGNYSLVRGGMDFTQFSGAMIMHK